MSCRTDLHDGLEKGVTSGTGCLAEEKGFLNKTEHNQHE